MISKSDGRVMLIKSVTDLDRFLALRKTRPGMIGSLLALEGAHALNGELSNLTKLYDASFRILGISHFFDNEAGGSAHGRQGYGLSAFGYELVKMSQEQRMIIDLSHASARVIDEVTNMVERPVMVSHTGVFGTCNNPRNLTDRQIKKIAELGGIIGITMVRRAVCGEQIEKIVAAIRYVSDLVGPDYVGVGSDFDGAITAPFDATGLPLLTKALLSQGFNEGQINQIMGSNALRMLRDALPND